MLPDLLRVIGHRSRGELTRASTGGHGTIEVIEQLPDNVPGVEF